MNISLHNKIPNTELIEQEKIGEGKFGTVWKGTWTQMDASVAIKIPDRSFNKDLESELNESIKALHPNIIRTYGISEMQFIIMELMDTALSGYMTELKKNGLTINRKIVNHIAKSVSDGLSYLHSCKIVHRALKSKSILLRFLPGGKIEVKISSFGFRKIINEITGVAQTSETKEVSLRYFPPECHSRVYKKNDFEVLQSADTYSYGMILWEMFEMRVPFSEHSLHSAMKLLVQGQQETIPDACPKPYEMLISKCWKVAFNERPKSCEVSNELQE